MRDEDRKLAQLEVSLHGVTGIRWKRALQGAIVLTVETVRGEDYEMWLFPLDQGRKLPLEEKESS